MKKIFEKNESMIKILSIVIYVILNSYCVKNFGTEDFRTVIVNTIISVVLLVLIITGKRTKYYGLTGVKNSKKYLYFLPLILIPSVNLFNGINLNHPISEIVFHILTMINVGFIEEIIFRGLLFKDMARTNLKSAIIVSSLTFGIGHIVNLFNGEALIPTLMQICYAIAIGYLFVTIFVKSKSLISCIITHQLINSLSIFNNSNNNSLFIITIFLIIVCVSYSIYLNKKIKD